MDMVKLAHQLVREECKKPTSHYAGIYRNHIVPMVRIAQRLAREFGADQEIVGIAAWLHDIGSILLGRNFHQVTGAAIARVLLREWGYPEDKIRLVEGCILCHRGSDNGNEPKSLEERIVAQADALSAFYNISGLFRGVFVEEGKDEGEGGASVRNKLEGKYNQLTLPGTRESVQSHYEAFMLLIGA